MEMDERKMRILQAIIDDYVLTGVPVGSRTIWVSSTSRMFPPGGFLPPRPTACMWTPCCRRERYGMTTRKPSAVTFPAGFTRWKT